MTGKRFVMYGNTVYEMKNDNKVELLPTDCFCLLNELNDENEQLRKEKKEIIQTILNYYNNDFNGHKESFECLLEDIGFKEDDWND